MTRLPVYSLQPALNGLDLAELEDEQLVGVAQAYEDPSAWGELMARCGELRERLLDRCISRCGLQDADRLDTQQEGVLWMVEAINRYQLEQAPGAPGCRFRTFLYRVLRARFIDSLRHRRHLQRHVQFVGTPGVWRKAVGEADRWGSAGTNGVASPTRM